MEEDYEDEEEEDEEEEDEDWSEVEWEEDVELDEKLELKKGVRVMIQNVRGQQELNGTYGIVQDYFAEYNRWNVKLEYLNGDVK